MKILIIIQRSNGDVFLSSPLINALKDYYPNVTIDMLVNDDTLAIAKTLKHVDNYHTYSYTWRKEGKLARYKKELNLIQSIYKKYDLSINLTASDRSVQYAIASAKKSISAVEPDSKKSWWKKLFLDHQYIFDLKKSIVLNNIEPLKILNIDTNSIKVESNYTQKGLDEVKELLSKDGIEEFIIFHPSAQYNYKVYPQNLRDELLTKLNDLDIPIIVTGGKSDIDDQISQSLPNLKNIYNYIATTSLDGYIALTHLAKAYIGMDTLNMHIAAASDTKVFAIFGPTYTSMWSPWENELQSNINTNAPLQTYGKITIFQADMECVACGLAGCDDKHGDSECLKHIAPDTIYSEVKKWLK
jgi:heptosyltransferase-3